MSSIEFPSLSQVDPNALMSVLNEDVLRVHLVDHDYFDAESIRAWVEGKTKVDAQPGCRIRAVQIDGDVAGWCGIEPDDGSFELSIVIAQRFWGSGLSIFRTLVKWADELEHKEVLFRLLDSRREYKMLKKMAKRVDQSEWSGRQFTTYHFSVEQLLA